MHFDHLFEPQNPLSKTPGFMAPTALTTAQTIGGRTKELNQRETSLRSGGFQRVKHRDTFCHRAPIGKKDGLKRKAKEREAPEFAAIQTVTNGIRARLSRVPFSAWFNRKPPGLPQPFRRSPESQTHIAWGPLPGAVADAGRSALGAR